ncbi:hypothetical protein ABLB69_14615 [Xenorhabdus khoisanae]|uniref:hypothetical protein n=1 Tax=Xenorhabdus khoisanae TaxID=880157 RepID=UPI0032B74BB2
MSDKITVVITAESIVRLRKRVEMDKSDYDKYEQLIKSDKKEYAINDELIEIAYKYGFDVDDDCIEDFDDLEEIEFTALDD